MTNSKSLREQVVPSLSAPAEELEVAIDRLAAGRMILLCDDCSREIEGDVLVGAEFVSAAVVNFMVTQARGIIYLALTPERCAELGLEAIGRRGNQSALGDSAMVSIEARDGVTTGISAADRARTIAVAVDPASRPEDLIRPGHVFPLQARPKGVLESTGRIEAAIEMAKSAGLSGAAILCQVMRDDGHMARAEDLDVFAAHHGIPVANLSQVVQRARDEESGGAPDPADAGRQIRNVMGQFATGVTVVTARDGRGLPVGTTANAISSVSLDPPLLLACLARASETLVAIRQHGRFGVNILAAEQRHHSDRFAAKGIAAGSHEVEFEDHELGVPLLPGALATIVCEVEAIHPAGDHEIVIGNARHLAQSDEAARPLIFYRGAYSQLTLEEDEFAR